MAGCQKHDPLRRLGRWKQPLKSMFQSVGGDTAGRVTSISAPVGEPVTTESDFADLFLSKACLHFSYALPSVSFPFSKLKRSSQRNKHCLLPHILLLFSYRKIWWGLLTPHGAKHRGVSRRIGLKFSLCQVQSL